MPVEGIRAVDARPTIDGELLARVANVGVREGWFVLPPDRGESRVFYRLSTVDPQDSPGEGTAVKRLFLVARIETGDGTIFDVELADGELTGQGPECWTYDDTLEIETHPDREAALRNAAELARAYVG